MRFRVFDRILLGLLLIIVIAAALAAAAFGLFIIPKETVYSTVDGLYSNRINTLIFAGAALLIIVIALRLFWALGSGGRKRAPASLSVRNDANGAVNVTVSTFTAIIHKLVCAVPGVTDSKESITKTDDGVSILLRLTTAPEAEIPQKTEEVQQTLLSEVERLTGMHVSQVHVMVDGAQDTVG